MDDSSSTPFTMPVAPAYGGNGGFGGFGGDWAWIIILLLAFNGGWGMGGGFGGGYEFPWLMNGQNSINTHVSDGFRDQMIQTTISSVGDKVTSGFGDIQTALCGGFAGVTAAVNGAQSAVAQQLYTNQIADLQSNFAIQTQLAQCCCDNKAGLADVKYTIASEECATRANSTANTQAILDKLCQLELDNYKRENDNLRTQLNMASLAASQTAQTAELRTSQATVANQLVSELRSCPIPSQPVYGNTPIFTCGGNNYGCGCGGVA